MGICTEYNIYNTFRVAYCKFLFCSTCLCQRSLARARAHTHTHTHNTYTYIYVCVCKGKVISLEARCGPEGG